MKNNCNMSSHMSMCISIATILSQSSLLLSAAEVAKVVVTPTMSIAAIQIASSEVFLIFIAAVILSSIAFLLKLLQNGNRPLFAASVRQSDRISAPLTYGIFRPVILMPKKTDWKNEKQLQYVLSHE